MNAGITLLNRQPCALAVGLWFLVCCVACVAAPVLRCKVDQGGVVRAHVATPVSDPYAVPSIDINGRFRFKAVVVGTPQNVDYVKLYVYESRSRQPVLLHQAIYRSPMPNTAQQEAALTGVQVVYASTLERELRYWCALQEDPNP